MPYDPNGPTNPDYTGHQTPQQPQQPSQPQYPQPGAGYPQYPQPGAGYPPSGPAYPPTGPGYPQTPQPGGAQPGYGQPPYPQAGYGAPPPGGAYPGAYPPGYAPAPPQQPRRNRGLAIGLSIAGAVVLCIVVCVAVVYGGGLYLRTTGSSLLTSVNATETADAQQSQATPTVAESILYQDSMTDSPSGWSSDSACMPKSDGYHVTGGTVCIGPDAASSDNVDITVTVAGVKTSTNTSYSLVFRHQSAGNFYSYEITPDGQWGMFKFVNGTATPVITMQSSAVIQTGSGATNTMRVLVVGSHFVMFVNDQQVGVADDATFTTGGIGLGNDDSDTTSEVVFTNLTVAQPQG